MTSRSTGLAIGFVLAIAAGFGAAYAILRLGAVVLTSGSVDAGILMQWTAPLGGLAIFSLIYAVGRGQALKWQFWLVAPVAVYLAVGAGLLVLSLGQSMLVATIVAICLTLAAAFGLFVKDAKSR